MTGSDHPDEARIKAGRRHDAARGSSVFTLSYGNETVTLDPGKTWIKLDQFKWIIRGLMEPPQSFHVEPNGTVDINGEKIAPDNPEGIPKLEQEINKRHAAAAARQSAPATAHLQALSQTKTPASGKAHFRVRLDHLGHFMVACDRGAEHMETGLRGFQTLVQNGLMLKPQNVHVDPLQRSIEIDGMRFECDSTGAQKLEEVLNRQYAPTLKADGEDSIDIKENPASPTGFDIHFVIIHSGVRFEVKGHLSQEKLDLLQDSSKCELLQAGVVLKLSPPYLLIRHKRPDGGEEKMPEFPDVHYRRISGMDLQQLFNHPLIRRNRGTPLARNGPVVHSQAAQIARIQVARNPQNKLLLWMECFAEHGGNPEGKALTHHNVADLNHRGVFQPQLDVTLSLDNRILGVLNKETHQEETIILDCQSSDEDLDQASRTLTSALLPSATLSRHSQSEASPTVPSEVALTHSDAEPIPPLPSVQQPSNPPDAAPRLQPSLPLAESVGSHCDPQPAAQPAIKPVPVAPPVVSKDATTPLVAQTASSAPELSAGPSDVSASPMPAESTPDEAIQTLFTETDPARVHQEVFRCLKSWLGVGIQDVFLSLPRVFENRRFEVITFRNLEITSVLDLRADDFFGFYLAHINDRNIQLVYACNGRRIMWGVDHCLLDMATAEPIEFKAKALLGLAQDKNRQFVFIVRSEFKDWIRKYENSLTEACARFTTASELAANPKMCALIWPEAPAPPASALTQDNQAVRQEPHFETGTLRY